MPSAGKGKASDKGKNRSCSPCCVNKDSEESPPLLPAKPLYKGDVMKPTQGTLPSSKAGFLVSFLVDARGGAMTGHRHWGMRVIIPPAAVQQPTRINCRYQKLTSLNFPPPFMEREALASRVIEVTPAGETFRSPVLIEIPHFASNAGAERETIVLRSDDGETWYEHVSDEVENGEIYQDVVTSVVMKDSNLERIYDVLEVTKGRIIRILTSKFPKYFAVLTRVREEVKSVGPDGGKVVLLHEPRLRATFPKNALYKKIKVGLQVQSLKPELVQAAFGRSVEVSKMIAVEPRKRKFHQPIFISIPLPCSPSKINPSTSIRLLCSVTGATDKAVWADLTGSTPLELCKDVVHFSTKVSAIFWILVIHDKQRDPESALTLASRLYEESILIPYLARFSIFYRENFPKAWVNTIRVYCMTDDKAEKVIRSLQGFRPLAISGDIEVPHTSSIAVKLSGNVIQLRQDPFTGELLAVSSIRTNEVKEPFVFQAFEENSMTILVEAKDPAKPVNGTLSFGRRLDHISATQQLPLCDLRFDVSSGDTSFVIQDGEVTAFDNGHAPDITDVAPAVKPFKTIEEEDPYEKIEIKKNLDGETDTKTKISQGPVKQNEKTKTSKKSEVTEKSKLKDSATTTTIVQSTKSNKSSSQDATSKTETETQKQTKETTIAPVKPKEAEANISKENIKNNETVVHAKEDEKLDTQTTEKKKEIEPEQQQETVPLMISKSSREDEKTELLPTEQKENTSEMRIPEDKLDEKEKTNMEDKISSPKIVEEQISKTKPDSKVKWYHRFMRKEKAEKTKENVKKEMNESQPTVNSMINKKTENTLESTQETAKKEINESQPTVNSISKENAEKTSESTKEMAKKEIDEPQLTANSMTKENTEKSSEITEETEKNEMNESQSTTISVWKENTEKKSESTEETKKEINDTQSTVISMSKENAEKTLEKTEESVKNEMNESQSTVNYMNKENEVCIYDVDDHGKTRSQEICEHKIQEDEGKNEIREEGESIHKGTSKTEEMDIKETKKEECMKEIVSDKVKKESDAFKKDDRKKNESKKSKKMKTQEFKANELEALRLDFAAKQGVKQMKLDTTSNKCFTANKQPDAEASQFEEKNVNDKSLANNLPSTDQNHEPVKEERKKKSKQTANNIEAEPLYEPIGKGNEPLSPPTDEKKVDISDITIEATELQSDDNQVVKADIDAKQHRKDDVIGFDIDITTEDKNPFGPEEEMNDITPIEVSSEINKTDESELPAKSVQPPLPARRKNSKQLSSSDSAQNVSLTSDKKSKKTSFIKEWQKDLKEFFSLGKKKNSDKSRSRGSSLRRSDNESRHSDFSKDDKIKDENKTSKEEDISKGKNYRFSSTQDTGSFSEEGDNLMKTEDIYGYTKEVNSTKDHNNISTDSTEKFDTEGKQEESNTGTKKTKEGEQETKLDTGTADEAIEKRRKKRRDRRKTNSESSCTKVEIPSKQVEDENQVSICTGNEKECKDANEDNPKQNRKRSKNKQNEKVESSAVESKTDLEGKDQSTKGKPKVIVPSPQGIPRPKPINKNRESIHSDDGDFIHDYAKVGRTGSVEETEEFRKAVESFDQIYLMESGNQSPEITSSRSSTLSRKMIKSQDELKPETSPNVAWKRLKTGKSFDESSSESQSNSQVTSKFEHSEKSTTEHQTVENKTKSFFSESKSFDNSTSSATETKTSSRKISEGVTMTNYSQEVSEKSQQEESFKVENISVIGQSNKTQSQSSTVETNQSSKQTIQKEDNVEKNSTVTKDNFEDQERNSTNQEYKEESNQSSKGNNKKSSKKNKNRKSTNVSEQSNNSYNHQSSVSSETTYHDSRTEASTAIEIPNSESNVHGSNSMSQENRVEPDQSSSSDGKKSSKKNKNRKSTHVSDQSNNNNRNQPAVSNDKKQELTKDEENIPSSNIGQTGPQATMENKKSSKKKNKKNKSIDLSDNSSDSPALSVKSEGGLRHPEDQTAGNQTENIAVDSKSSGTISILGEKYDVENVNNKDTSDICNFEENKEPYLLKKDSKGFLSEQERQELEEENLLVKAIREFHAQSSNDSTHSDISTQVLGDEEFSNQVKYSEVEKDIMQKSIDAQESIRTALEDIDQQKSNSQDKSRSEIIRVQKHSLSIQDGVLIEQTTTEKFSQLPIELGDHTGSCTIDPDSLRNVDGQAKQRKGSSRFSKRQGSKSKSPGLGSQNSFSGPEDREEDEEEKVNNTDLTTRLEETNVRMKKLSEVFTTMCEESSTETGQDEGEQNQIISETSIEDHERQTSFHPLTRTTQIMRKDGPLDDVIETMIHKPENLSSSSQFSSSVEQTPSSPLMYRATVTQHIDEKDEYQ